MHEANRILARNIERLLAGKAERARRRPALDQDRTLQALVADLVTARVAAGMTQQEVADRMSSTKSAVSRLESGTRTRPTLTTIEKYARAVGAVVEIRIRIR